MIARTTMVVLILTLVIVAGFREANSQSASTGDNGFDLVDNTGNIRKPSGYRDHYQSLGTYTVASLRMEPSW